MECPKRLMGWVRDGNTPYEVRLKHEPNLFCHNRYVVYKISKLTALPIRLMINALTVKGHYRKIHFWGGYTLMRGSEVIVEFNGVEFNIPCDERGLVRLSLYSILDNIR